MRLRKDLRNKAIQDLSFFISVIVKRTSTRVYQWVRAQILSVSVLKVLIKVVVVNARSNLWGRYLTK